MYLRTNRCISLFIHVSILTERFHAIEARRSDCFERSKFIANNDWVHFGACVLRSCTVSLAVWKQKHTVVILVAYPISDSWDWIVFIIMCISFGWIALQCVCTCMAENTQW